MKLAVLKESIKGEGRVALTPDLCSKYADLGIEVIVESGAGEGSSFSDSLYSAGGASIVKGSQSACSGADVIVKVNCPSISECDYFVGGQILLCQMNCFGNREILDKLAGIGVEVIALELMPRITRAQSMDILSSQNNIAGYRAVIVAAEKLGRAFPMMMTAAGTVAPVKLLVMGVGVAGLQAIATGRRLGAIVSASDVRSATKEQVESLGAKFVAVEDDEFMGSQSESGYAKEMSESYKRKQEALVAEVIVKQDVVITTALIPGRPAPRLIGGDMLASMKSGSVIVDMASGSGGNCEFSKSGKDVIKSGVHIIGGDMLAAQVAQTTSGLFAKNVYTFISQFMDKESGGLVLPSDDDIIVDVLAVSGGKIFSRILRELWG